jgi:hypothetical protein
LQLASSGEGTADGEEGFVGPSRRPRESGREAEIEPSVPGLTTTTCKEVEMAGMKLTTPAPGVKRTDSVRGFCLQGRKDALIASGLLRVEWFPTLTERNKRGNVVRTACTMHEGREIEIRHDGGQRYTAFCRHSDEERARYEEREQFEEAQAEEQKELAGMPTSHEAYRARAVRLFETMFEDTIVEFFGKRQYHGYSYAPEVLAAIEAKMQEAREILETGRTLYSQERQDARIAAIRAVTAEADPGLRAFLERVTKQ